MIQGRNRAAAILIAALALGACGDSSGPPDSCPGGTPIALGATVNGTLQQGDDLDVDGAFLDRYALRVASSGSIEITMSSTELDSYLWLLTSNGAVITSDDDSGGGISGVDAQIVRSLDRGCFLIDATTFPGESGPYTLSVQRQ